jgi:carbon monoxide dehydrogenase subunit G
MNFENTFEVDAPIDQVYEALMDVERVAPCVPGAQVLDRKSDDAYDVAIKVKVGPMSMLYKGTVEIVDRQPEEHRAKMRARARESRGQGNADAQVQMTLSSDNGTTRGTIDTDVKLSGKAAAMGGGVIKEVSGKLVDQFAKNLAAMLGEGAAPGAQPTPEAAAAAGPATPTAPAPSDPGPSTRTEPPASSFTPEAAAPATPTEPSPPPATPPAAAHPAEAEALDVGNLVGTMLVGRLRDPKVLGGVGLLIALLLLLRRRR